MKKCKKCNKIKELTDFHPDKSYPSGYKAQCKLCKNSYNKEYSAKPENKAKLASYYKKWNKENPKTKEKQKEYNKTFYEKHKVLNTSIIPCLKPILKRIIHERKG